MSTQWVVSLNTALSIEFLYGNPRQRVQPHIGLTDSSRPSTLIRLTSRSHISSGFPFGMCIEKNEGMVASYRYVGAPVRQENHLPKVASRSLALFESVSFIRPGSRAEATRIVDSWNRPVVS